ncbi:hypothetical protein RhiJN_01234 [Ceratobasidium sp. AG-Ba]|nr:hypothetical protein RhiJN_01234 [Ceratobasidium sp. AG-Ba]QRW02268.1 hypothetical protein RhiLY_01265 [Ceratobasidium sp. AG-Ba]
MATPATYQTEVGLSRLRQKQLRAAEQPGEADVSITRVEENIEGVAHLHSDKPFSRNTEKRLELKTVRGTMDVDVVMDGRERLVLEAIGEKREANISLKITRRAQYSRFDLLIQTPGDIDLGLPLDFTGIFIYEHAKTAYFSSRAKTILGPDSEFVEYLPDGCVRRKLGNMVRIAGSRELVGDSILIRCEHEDAQVRVMMWDEEVGSPALSLSALARRLRKKSERDGPVSFRRRDPTESRLCSLPALNSDF